MKNKDSTRVKCLNCGYEWTTLSDHKFVSCPSCLDKVKIKETEEERYKAIRNKILTLNKDHLIGLKHYIEELLLEND